MWAKNGWSTTARKISRGHLWPFLVHLLSFLYIFEQFNGRLNIWVLIYTPLCRFGLILTKVERFLAIFSSFSSHLTFYGSFFCLFSWRTKAVWVAHEHMAMEWDRMVWDAIAGIKQSSNWARDGLRSANHTRFWFSAF